MIESILHCTESSSYFLGWEETLISPFIYGTHFFTLFLGTVIATILFIRYRQIPLMRILSYCLLLLSAWLFVDIILWVETLPETLGLFWSASMLIEPILDICVFYLFLVFVNNGQDCSISKKMWLFLLAVPSLILTPTRLGILGLDVSNCQRDIVEGALPFYTYILAGILCVLIVIISLRALKKLSGIARTYLLVFSGTALAFILVFSGSNFIGSLTGEWDIAQTVMFAMPLLIVSLVYSANKYLPEEEE